MSVPDSRGSLVIYGNDRGARLPSKVHGGLGYPRDQPFEHIDRHHRRYGITEGAGEIQTRRVAGCLFGFIKPDTFKGVTG